jgi:predicted enzyme related to lactoylglutathione lyase
VNILASVSSREISKGADMTWWKVVTVCLLAATVVTAQEGGIRVRGIRVLAIDPEAVAGFYERTFGMSETRRPVNTDRFKEIMINSGANPELAKAATGTPIIIATRPKDAPTSAMASLILDVPDIEKTVELVKANGGTLMRPISKFENLRVAMVKDPDGNQIELVMMPK